jgi:hypothetical protein
MGCTVCGIVGADARLNWREMKTRGNWRSEPSSPYIGQSGFGRPPASRSISARMYCGTLRAGNLYFALKAGDTAAGGERAAPMLGAALPAGLVRSTLSLRGNAGPHAPSPLGDRLLRGPRLSQLPAAGASVRAFQNLAIAGIDCL